MTIFITYNLFIFRNFLNGSIKYRTNLLDAFNVNALTSCLRTQLLYDKSYTNNHNCRDLMIKVHCCFVIQNANTAKITIFLDLISSLYAWGWIEVQGKWYSFVPKMTLELQFTLHKFGIQLKLVRSVGVISGYLMVYNKMDIY